MNILILNHHFSQDIVELRNSKVDKNTIKLIGPDYFANHAKELFSAEVFGGDLTAFHKDRYSVQRQQYKKIAIELLYDLYKIFRFDVFIAPSDTFFYLRDVITACHSIGVPFIVVQKELGVSPFLFESHADELKGTFPVICDWMTTCSEESKRFWCRAGAIPERVSVVGQPRFDYYFRQLSEEEKKADPIMREAKNGKRILFLSYDLNAYSAGTLGGKVNMPWKELHDGTVGVLAQIAASGEASVYIKPHPQHNTLFLNDLKQKVSSAGDVILLQGNVDTRRLIFESDIVIGFQSTALLEAMAINKKVVYTFWSDTAEQEKEGLLPFHRMDNSLTIADSPEALYNVLLNTDTIIGGPELTEEQVSERKHHFQALLGPVDGKSSLRTWDVIDHVYASYLVSDECIRKREEITSDINAYKISEMRKSRSVLRKISTLIFLLKYSPFRKSAGVAFLNEQLVKEKQRVKECELTEEQNTADILAGGSFFSFFHFLKRTIKNKL